MGKQRTRDKHLPRRVYLKSGTYWFVDYQNAWHKLGRTESEMYKALATLMDDSTSTLLADIFARYAIEVLPTKAPKTQRQQESQLKRLVKAFGHMQIHEVKRRHIAAYLDARTAKVAANREIALFSHVFTKAGRWGLFEGTNPCAGLERNKERPGTRYITNAEFLAVYRRATPVVRFCMAIAYLTGQRQADVLSLRVQQLSDEGITFTQDKTGAKVLVQWTPALIRAVNRAMNYGRTPSIAYVIHNGQGGRYSSSGFQTAWQRLMKKCMTPDENGNTVIGERFTFRDIRAKARSDGEDENLLGHSNPAAMARIYQRKPVPVRPVK